MKLILDSELDEYHYLHKKALDGTLTSEEKKRHDILSKKLYGEEEVKVEGKQF